MEQESKRYKLWTNEKTDGLKPNEWTGNLIKTIIFQRATVRLWKNRELLRKWYNKEDNNWKDKRKYEDF